MLITLNSNDGEILVNPHHIIKIKTLSVEGNAQSKVYLRDLGDVNVKESQKEIKKRIYFEIGAIANINKWAK